MQRSGIHHYAIALPQTALPVFTAGQEAVLGMWIFSLHEGMRCFSVGSYKGRRREERESSALVICVLIGILGHGTRETCSAQVISTGNTHISCSQQQQQQHCLCHYQCRCYHHLPVKKIVGPISSSTSCNAIKTVYCGHVGEKTVSG